MELQYVIAMLVSKKNMKDNFTAVPGKLELVFNMRGNP